MKDMGHTYLICCKFDPFGPRIASVYYKKTCIWNVFTFQENDKNMDQGLQYLSV